MKLGGLNMKNKILILAKDETICMYIKIKRIKIPFSYINMICKIGNKDLQVYMPLVDYASVENGNIVQYKQIGKKIILKYNMLIGLHRELSGELIRLNPEYNYYLRLISIGPKIYITSETLENTEVLFTKERSTVSVVRLKNKNDIEDVIKGNYTIIYRPVHYEILDAKFNSKKFFERNIKVENDIADFIEYE